MEKGTKEISVKIYNKISKERIMINKKKKKDRIGKLGWKVIKTINREEVDKKEAEYECKEGNDQIYLKRKEKEEIERFLKSNIWHDIEKKVKARK